MKCISRSMGCVVQQHSCRHRHHHHHHDATATAIPKLNRRVMLLGAPGVGKGTYASGASRQLGIPHIAAGDIIREEIKSGSPIGNQMQQYTKKGLLVPDTLVIDFMLTYLHGKIQSLNGTGFLLDGFPRTIQQAQAFQQTDVKLDLVINMTQTEDIIVKKISGRRVCAHCGFNYNLAHIKQEGIDMPPILPKEHGVCDHCGAKDSLLQREDDKEEVVRHRLKIYNEQTAPLIDFYSQLGILKHFRVNGGAKELLPTFVGLLQE